jgi:N-acetylmuramoyl-L-alanine amidase
MTTRIALSIGHTLMSPGAKNSDGIYEQPFNARVAKSTQRHLQLFTGINIDVLYRTKDSYDAHCRDMVSRCFGAYDVVYDLHFNSSQYPAKGAEVLCLKDSKGEREAKMLTERMRVSGWEMRGSNGVSYLSQTDRGYELLAKLEAIKIATVIVEPCFGNNKLDPNYHRVFINDGEGYAIFLANHLKETYYGN